MFCFERRKSCETLAVIIISAVGFLALRTSLNDAINTNDLRITRPDVVASTETTITFNGYIANESAVTLHGLSVVADAYDREKRIVGTGTVIASPDTDIRPAHSLHFEIKVTIPAGIDAVDTVMLIPRSTHGTGKLTTIYQSSSS